MKKVNLPIIPLRGLTLFPHMVLHFDVGREKSIKALDEAMMGAQEVFLVSQKEARIEDPTLDDMYTVGTICYVRQLLKLPGNTMRVLVEGKERAQLKELTKDSPYFQGEIEIIETKRDIFDTEEEALVRSVREAFDEFIKLSAAMPPEALLSMDDITDSVRFVDTISAYMTLKTEEKQELLEIQSLKKRLSKLLLFVKNELEILRIERKIGSKVKSTIDKTQRDYYLREQIRAIQEELGEVDDSNKEINKYKARMNKAKLPKEAKERLLSELERLKNSGPYSSEGGIIRTYIEWILDLPWNKFTKDNNDIVEARKILNTDHYGLKEVKDRIIEYLAVKSKTNSLKGPIICLVGPPGVGKTSIGKSIARAVNRNFVRMSLGGVRDEAEIRGHRKTYLGAIPGRIIYGMKQAKSSNPLFLLDEIDKMANDFRGDPADALLEVLDGEQNSTFRDHYLELEYDLSKVMFITTANSLDTIPRPLLDRMEIIEVPGYTYEEKLNIAKLHIIPKQLTEHGLNRSEVKFNDNAIREIIDGYTLEAGVRQMERQLASIIRKAIAKMLENDRKTMTINEKVVREFLGHPRFEYEKAEELDKIGVATGLAWTAYGGDTLPIEVQVMQGNGRLELTGSLGDVMKESARAAYSYIRRYARELGVPLDFYKTSDIHIHVPEGATPKDGPSAGITMATAMISALSGKPVSHEVAMTGEITLTGRVLPIGGLREKAMSANRAGITTIIMPKKNIHDIEKIPDTVREKMTFIPVSEIGEVINRAILDVEGRPVEFKE